MKPETKLKRRIGQVIELCKQLGYPFVIGYANCFNDKRRPLSANVYGAGVTPQDVGILLKTLHEVAEEQLGQEINEFTNQMRIEKLPTDRQEAMGYLSLDEACSLRGG